MNLSELLGKGLVRKVDRDAQAAGALMRNAGSDLVAAEDSLKAGHADWALAIAYNAMLNAGRALMASMGYRAPAEAHHLTAVQFCAAVLPEKSSGIVASFNRYRSRRHDVVYGTSDSVGGSEAESAIKNAKAFVEEIKKRVKKWN